MKMTLTQIERQILFNQNKILSFLDPDNNGEYEQCMEILSSGYEREYNNVFGVNSQDDIYTHTICEETVDILNMYRRINNSYAQLSDDKKATLDMDKIKFEGFDANNDRHFYYTEFMIEKQGKWDEIKDMYLNSHNAFTIIKYRRMLTAFRERLGDSLHQDLSAEDLEYIIKESN